ncbi:MAG: hypothetical protein LKE46_09320 [Clostridium sp.]|jgi:hypothetical protein|uniref:hypothetical protein n=1 Tax=Clostridium sp. TaxID=1506 RepID=UPI0025C34F07|nr:hypothetical protein [Clostridium sp.]MCH3964467.1 hypothetical protein [Clostridium sp.]MCI1715641.1 hypothetical protein [Clostridium sp.]MCI1799566.1 hypothetical protein [Clostridium sp.]MCI1813825.1 hypothetical protein [Clostridium sp.]MCI1870378.1 hypothetical protein [Clostridium sp.]
MQMIQTHAGRETGKSEIQVYKQIHRGYDRDYRQNEIKIQLNFYIRRLKANDY